MTTGRTASPAQAGRQGNGSAPQAPDAHDKTSFGRVGVLYGGRSAERDVSLMSGAGVHAALQDAGVDAYLFDTGEQSLSALEQAGFDRVFIALHGRHGEDGTVQGALELLGIPYTGSGPLASSLAMDKIMTKKIWLRAGLPTPPYAVLVTPDDVAEAPRHCGLPLIVKPASEGSTIGVTRVDDAAALAQAWHLAAGFDRAVLAERFVQGRELTVAVLGDGAQARALPIVEIVAPDGNYDYEHKYLSDATQYLCPAPLDAALTARVLRLAEQAYAEVGCAGWGRVDIMLSDDGEPWLLEVNTSPGMTSHSLVPMAAAAEGMSYQQLCLTILAGASCKTPVRTGAQEA